MKKVIAPIFLGLIAVSLYASTDVVKSTLSTIKAIPIAATKKKVSVKELLLQASAEQKKGHLKISMADYLRAAQMRSGYAYLHLGKLLEKTNPKQALVDYQRAAQFGYPISYTFIAEMYQAGEGVAKNDFLSSCYMNLGKVNPGKQFMDICMQKEGTMFDYSFNEGFQNRFEAKKNAIKLYQSFCEGSDHYIVNPSIRGDEVSILRSLACRSTKKINDDQLTENDLVMRNSKIFQYKRGKLLIYQAPLFSGQIVYKENRPFTPYIYNGKRLQPAPNGTSVKQGNNVFVVENGRLKLD
jgi:hypothetical protein